MKAKALRRTLLIVLAVLSQGILAVHDAQHTDAQPSTCTVCQAHLPLITGESPALLSALPETTVHAPAPRRIEATEADRPYESFRSRAPPEHLT